MKETISPKIKIIGVGRAGFSICDGLLASNLRDVELIPVDSDYQLLQRSRHSKTITMGENSKPRPFCRTRPEWGRRAARDDEEIICNALKDSELVFVTAGMGGGFGTGAAPVIADTARKSGAITIAVISEPFKFEGKKRLDIAKKGVSEIADVADFTVLIQNNRLLEIISPHTKIPDAFKVVDQMAVYGINGIIELYRIEQNGYIIDNYENFKTFAGKKGISYMGVGIGDGIVDAMRNALRCPLLGDVALERAENIILNITGPNEKPFSELHFAIDLLRERLNDDAIIGGGWTGEKDQPSVTLYATNLGEVDV